MAVKLGGKKGEKYTLGQNFDINVTPFVDVMLVLLIIFMVSIPQATTAIKIDLPPVQPPPPGEPQAKPTYLSLQQNGTVVLVDHGNPGPTALDTLDADLTHALNVPDPKNQAVLIRADAKVKYKDFMGLVNQLQTDGYYKVALITEDEPTT
jgi:biopolymer transport protein ExbD